MPSKEGGVTMEIQPPYLNPEHNKKNSYQKPKPRKKRDKKESFEAHLKKAMKKNKGKGKVDYAG